MLFSSFSVRYGYITIAIVIQPVGKLVNLISVRWVNMLNLNFVYHQLELPKMIFHLDLFLVKKMAKTANDLKIDVKKVFRHKLCTFDLGGKYVVFVSSRSVKMRGFSFLCFLSFYTFLGMCVYFSFF